MPKLCSVSNQTYISLDLKIKHILSVDNNRIIGVLGTCIDKSLCEYRKRKCTLRGENHLGVRLTNGTYTGILGLFQGNKADFLLKDQPDFIDEPWLKKSIPIRSERFVIVQQIFENDQDVYYFDLINNFQFGLPFLSAYFASFFFIISFSYLLNKSNKKNSLVKLSKDKIAFLNIFSSKRHHYQNIGFFLLFLHLFFWFSQLFITNSIKTNKVVVDTTDLIKDRNEILSTKKIICFIDEEIEVNIAKDSPKDSLLYRMYNEKTVLKKEMVKEKVLIGNDKCLMKRSFGMVFFARSQAVLTTSETTINFLLVFFSQIAQKYKIWILNKGIHQFNSMFFFSLRNKESAKITGYQYTEHGISPGMFNCFFNVAESIYSKFFRVYNNLEDYINDRTDFSDLDIRNFKSIFFIYFLICAIIIVAYATMIIAHTASYFVGTYMKKKFNKKLSIEEILKND